MCDLRFNSVRNVRLNSMALIINDLLGVKGESKIRVLFEEKRRDRM